MASKEIRKQREYPVCKSNEIIRNSRFSMTTQQQKIVLFLISRVTPTDQPYQRYQVSVSEFCKVCGIDCGNGQNYINVKQSIKGLADNSIWIKQPNGKELLFRWLNDVELIEHSGIIEFSFSKYISEQLTGLKKQYTRYGLINVLPMRSKYAIRLYELLKSYEGIGRDITLTLDSLKQHIDAENYDNLKDFKRRVLDAAITEINAYTDMIIDYELGKSGRSRGYNCITFTISQTYPTREKRVEDVRERVLNGERVQIEPFRQGNELLPF